MDDLPLLLEYAFVLPEGSADLQVLIFDNALHAVDFTADRGILQMFIRAKMPVTGGQQIHYTEALDQIVLQADKKARGSGIALSASAASELIVDTPALMLVRTDHIQTTQPHDLVSVLRWVPAQYDIGPPPRPA